MPQHDAPESTLVMDLNMCCVGVHTHLAHLLRVLCRCESTCKCVVTMCRLHDTNGNGTVDLAEFQKLHSFLTSMQAS
jgi:hypothetical protein